jgi:hypothetical protein
MPLVDGDEFSAKSQADYRYVEFPTHDDAGSLLNECDGLKASSSRDNQVKSPAQNSVNVKLREFTDFPQKLRISAKEMR